MKKKKFPVINTGAASVLTVFVILAMVAFALLTYMTARKNAAFSQDFADAARAYQEAEAQAWEEIARIDQELHTAWSEGTFSEIAGTEYAFTVPCGEEKELQVELYACDPQENSGSLYRITSFTQITTKEWEDKSTLNLMKP